MERNEFTETLNELKTLQYMLEFAETRARDIGARSLADGIQAARRRAICCVDEMAQGCKGQC